MSQIYLRSGMAPMVQPSIEEVLSCNLIGNNVGNLIFAYSIYRSLMTSDDVGYLPNRYAHRIEDADYINENCSYFILPLADMFRQGAEQHIMSMTRLIKRLTIPAIIVGVGLRAPLGTDLDAPFSFDPVVKDFLYAVKEKSALIGLRGETTGRYVERFGLKEDKDYMVIGCPSMYTFGDYLPRKELKLDKDGRIAVNCSHICPQESYDFTARIMEEYENAHFLPQRLQDLWLLYGGQPMARSKLLTPHGYPLKLDHPYYQQNRVKMFLNAQSWINYLKGMDFSVGSRFHGSVAAILAGTPSVILCHDNRMKELTEYHHIPHVMANELKEGMQLSELVDSLDFDAMFKHHKENYLRYKKFLQANGVSSLFDQQDRLEDTVFDHKMARMDLPGEVPTAVGISREELSGRWDRIYHCRKEFADFRMNRIRTDKQNELKEKDRTIADLQQEISWLTEEVSVLNKSTLGQETKRVFSSFKDKCSHVDRTNYERARAVEDYPYIHSDKTEKVKEEYSLEELMERMWMNFSPMDTYDAPSVSEDPLKKAYDELEKMLAPDPEDSKSFGNTKAKLLVMLRKTELSEDMTASEIVKAWKRLLKCHMDYHKAEYSDCNTSQKTIIAHRKKEIKELRRNKKALYEDWRILNYSKVKWDIEKLLLKYLDAITRKDRDNLARARKVSGHKPDTKS